MFRQIQDGLEVLGEPVGAQERQTPVLVQEARLSARQQFRQKLAVVFVVADLVEHLLERIVAIFLRAAVFDRLLHGGAVELHEGHLGFGRESDGVAWRVVFEGHVLVVVDGRLNFVFAVDVA